MGGTNRGRRKSSLCVASLFLLPLLIVFSFWDEGQPDDWDYRENGEDCGQLHPLERRERRLWNDADCNITYRYICEKRA